MATIELFEPFHFGIKIRSKLDLNLIGNLLKSLKEVNEIKVLIDQIDLNAFPIITLAEKDGAIIQLNLPSNAINVIGNGPDPTDAVMEVKDILLTSLEKLGIDLKIAVLFYELIVVVSIKTDETPLAVFGKLNLDITEFEKFNASINGIRIASIEIDNDTDLFEYMIEPKFLSRDNRYSLQVIRRSKSLNEIIEFQKNLKPFIIRSIEKMESNE